MVEIFKTNLKQRKAGPVVKILAENFPEHKINLDLEDCDRILRVEGEKINARKVITVLKEEGFYCEILDN